VHCNIFVAVHLNLAAGLTKSPEFEAACGAKVDAAAAEFY
jgi:hypothetical protein